MNVIYKLKCWWSNIIEIQRDIYDDKYGIRKNRSMRRRMEKIRNKK